MNADDTIRLAAIRERADKATPGGWDAAREDVPWLLAMVRKLASPQAPSVTDEMVARACEADWNATRKVRTDIDIGPWESASFPDKRCSRVGIRAALEAALKEPKQWLYAIDPNSAELQARDEGSGK